jgi:hypothetical protein
MSQLKTWFQIACLGLLGWAAVETALFLRSLRLAGDELNFTLSEIRTKSLPDLNGVLIQAGLVLDQVRQTAETQQATAQETLQHTARATRAAADTLERANAVLVKLETEVLPEATETLRKTSQGVEAVTSELAVAVKGASDGLRPVLEGAAESTAGATKNLEETTQHAEELVEHYKKKLMKPAHWAKTFALTVLEFGAKVGSILAGFAK